MLVIKEEDVAVVADQILEVSITNLTAALTTRTGYSFRFTTKKLIEKVKRLKLKEGTTVLVKGIRISDSLYEYEAQDIALDGDMSSGSNILFKGTLEKYANNILRVPLRSGEILVRVNKSINNVESIYGLTGILKVFPLRTLDCERKRQYKCFQYDPEKCKKCSDAQFSTTYQCYGIQVITELEDL